MAHHIHETLPTSEHTATHMGSAQYGDKSGDHRSERRPTFFPTEILLKIFQYAIGGPGCRVKWNFDETDHYRLHYPHAEATPNDIAKSTCTLCPLLNLYSWALVNRQWNAVVTPILYSGIDIHTLAIPGRVVKRPVLLRRDVWPFGINKEKYTSSSVTCLLAEPTLSENLGRVVKIPKYGTHARMVTRQFEKGIDDDLVGAEIIESRHKWDKTSPREDQQYLLEFEYAPGEFEIDDTEPDYISYNTKAMFAYAPIRSPDDCCFPSHHHHNFTPEWWDLLRIWEDPTEQNPITEYTLNRVIRPLLRTLTARPDLANLVTKLQLPLVVYQDYIIPPDDSVNKIRPLTFFGSDVTKPEEQRLRLRESKRNASKALFHQSTLVQLLQSTLRLTQLCQRLEVVEGYWSLDLTGLHEMSHEDRERRAAMSMLSLLGTSQENLIPPQAASPQDGQSGSNPKKQTNRISRLFTRVIQRKSSKNKLAESESANSTNGSSSEALGAESQSSNAETHSQPAGLDSSQQENQLKVSDAFHQQRRDKQPTDPSVLWLELFTFAITRMKRLKLEFASPMAMSLGDCRWGTHCGTDPQIRLCEKHYWHHFSRLDKNILIQHLLQYSLFKHAPWQSHDLNNLVHLEFSTIEDDAIYNPKQLSRVLGWLSHALNHGLRNFRSLAVMDGYIPLLDIIPHNRLETLQVSRWHNASSHIVGLLIGYLKRSHESLGEDKFSVSALKSLTLDTMSSKLGTTVWDGLDRDIFHSPNSISTSLVVFSCGASRRIFNEGGASTEHFLKLWHLHRIIGYAPNLQELVLRRGRLALDEFWKMQLEARLMRDWTNPQLGGDDKAPPIAHNLKTLAFLVWGNSLRDWLLQTLTEGVMFPKLEHVTYAPAVQEYHRRKAFRTWYIEGQEAHLPDRSRCNDFRFWGWDEQLDARAAIESDITHTAISEEELLQEATQADQLILETLRKRGITVVQDQVMASWGIVLPKYNSKRSVPWSHATRWRTTVGAAGLWWRECMIRELRA